MRKGWHGSHLAPRTDPFVWDPSLEPKGNHSTPSISDQGLWLLLALTMRTVIGHPWPVIVLDDALALLMPPQCALLAAISLELRLILMTKAIACGISAKTAFTNRKWMAIVSDLVQDLDPGNKTPVDTHLGL